MQNLKLVQCPNCTKMVDISQFQDVISCYLPITDEINDNEGGGDQDLKNGIKCVQTFEGYCPNCGEFFAYSY